jgi:signal transduction histidine kinase
MELHQPVLPPAQQDDPCDWRAITLGLAALLAQPAEPPRDSLTEVAQHLKTPVDILRAHAARLRRRAVDQPGAEATHEVAARIVELADLMSDWVSAMLDVQRLRLGKLPLRRTAFDLVDLVGECVDQISAASVEPLAISRPARVLGTLPVYADRARLGQVIGAMLSRTAQSDMTDPLRVDLATQEWLDGRPRAVLLIAPASRHLAPADLARLGEPQSDLDLDLYVARELVRLHGGELWAEPARAGPGGAAVLVLPLDFSPDSHTVLAQRGPC